MLHLIIVGNGTNNLVESHRGLKKKLVDLPKVPEADSDDECTIRDLIKKAEDEYDERLLKK